MRGASGGSQAKDRGGEKDGEEERWKEVSINNARPRLEDVEDRKINHPSSLAFLPTFIRTTIGRGNSLSLSLSGPPPRTNAAPQTYPPFLAFYSMTTRPPPPLLLLPSPVFFAFHATERIRTVSLARAATPAATFCRRIGPLNTMLNCENINGNSNNRPISISRQLKKAIYV